MTAEQREVYLNSGGCMCPFCESMNICAGETDHSDNFKFQSVICTDCGKKWTDTYKLTDVTELGE